MYYNKAYYMQNILLNELKKINKWTVKMKYKIISLPFLLNFRAEFYAVRKNNLIFIYIQVYWLKCFVLNYLLKIVGN